MENNSNHTITNPMYNPRTDPPLVVDPAPPIEPSNKKGCLKPFLLAVGFFILIGIIYLGISSIFTRIPQIFSYSFIFIGVILFLIGKLLLRKKALFYKALLNGDIELSSPKYIDYLLWGGQIAGILGIMMSKYVLTVFKNDLVYGIIFGVFILGFIFIRIMSLRFQTDDRIIIGDNSIMVDTWSLKKRNIINLKKESISKIVYLKKINSRKYSTLFRIEYSICIEYTEGIELKRFTIDNDDFNLDRNFLIEALKEKNYLVHLETERDDFNIERGEKSLKEGHAD